MKTGARAAAAIEILADLGVRRRPAAEAIKDWMQTHRFAGSKDRSAIGDIVFGALRWKASSAFRFEADAPRSWVFGALRWGFGHSPEAIEQSCYEPHAPAPPTEAERAALSNATTASRLEGAPPWVRGDYPEWLDSEMEAAFGADRALEGAALALPAPLDLRANRLKCAREHLAVALSQSRGLSGAPDPTPLAPDGLRIPWRAGGSFAWNTEPSFLDGWFEVQDEGSQLAAVLAGAQPGMQVGDVCAGGGGKTLALAAIMQNTGQIYAHDVDAGRLAPLKSRAERAGVRNLQLRYPRRDRAELFDLAGQLDLVVVDAPCTGSGTWRRNPDAKWRVRPGALAQRQSEQQQALTMAAELVRPGGRLAYITCSVLPSENSSAIARFLEEKSAFRAIPIDEMACELPDSLRDRLIKTQSPKYGVQLTPRITDCDGFYIALLQHKH